jgi:serine/arginine repetitive matrix protein 2
MFCLAWQFQDESAQRRATLAGPERLLQVEAIREPRRSSIDNSEVMVAKAPETPKGIQPTVEARPQPHRTSLDSRPKPRLSFYFKEDGPVDDTSASSTKEVPTAVSNEPPGNPGLLQRRSSDPTVVATKLPADGKLSCSEDKEKKSRDLKGMIKGSFKRKGHRGNNQESSGSSGSSFDLRETEHLKKVSELQTERKEGSNNLYLSGQDGLGEDEEYKDFSGFTGSPNGWLESREGSTPRLTVELKDGPQLTRKDDQRVLSDDRSRLSGLEDSGEHMTQNDHAPVHLGFKRPLNAIDYMDLRNMQRDRARRSVEGRESPGPSFDGKAVTSRLSVEGTSAPRQSSGTPRRSVDGREPHHQGPGQNRFAHYVQRFRVASSPLSLRRKSSWVNSPGRTVDGAWESDMYDRGVICLIRKDHDF